MCSLHQIIKSISPMPRPPISAPVRNRIDAVPSLLQYHESGLGAKPSPPRETPLLPPRTRLAAGLLSLINLAQTEAYYEELDSIPSSLVGLKSAFSAGHWLLSTGVLRHIMEWIEVTCPNELFIGTHLQVVGFRDARIETVEEIRKELGRRERNGDAVGLKGGWEVIGEKEEGKKGNGKASEGDENGEGNTGMDERALEEAREVGRRAAGEARDRDEYEILM
ncbi:hypothetical protein BKA63DRAFT_418773 [Paraphoma chrysanthemicola]|nr:hypothetical protein BKA63DRAFT_418773 [Paraphoma chrysanthemicola]